MYQYLFILVCVASASAAGETDYDAAYCAEGNGAPNLPEFTPYDLGTILQYIGLYSTPQGAVNLFSPYGFTNWYAASDIRESLAKLAVLRGILDLGSLWDMYLQWSPPVSNPCDDHSDFNRRIDGTCNDRVKPAMGSAGYRFGRNVVPFTPAAFPSASEEALLTPSPREVSRKLLARREGEDAAAAPFLNMLSVAWIQFMVHDWMSHGANSAGFFEFPLAEDDPLRESGQTHMRIQKTQPDPTRLPHEEAILPPTFLNEVTHWWDASQLYGSDDTTANSLRSFEGGKLNLPDGELPIGKNGIPETGFNTNWWVGLHIMHTVFAKEHNAICDTLAAAYPDMDDQQLYDKAKMTNAALMARIHTLEWTKMILPNTALELGMDANWGGLNQYFTPPFAGLPPGVPPSLSPILFGIAGGERDLKKNPITGEDVPFSLTEEFVSVYRMHQLLPDRIVASNFKEKEKEKEKEKTKEKEKKEKYINLKDTVDKKATKMAEKLGMLNLLHTFGVNTPNQLVLHNYPDFLTKLKTPGGTIDLGAIDILRDRERGVPRYNSFRRELRLPPFPAIGALSQDPDLVAEVSAMYNGDIEQVDLLVGMMLEQTRPTCFGFGETQFQVFLLMASRRLQGDRFYTNDYRPEVYTQEGINWVEGNSMKTVLLRHFPELEESGLADITNAFFPWETPLDHGYGGLHVDTSSDEEQTEEAASLPQGAQQQQQQSGSFGLVFVPLGIAGALAIAAVGFVVGRTFGHDSADADVEAFEDVTRQNSTFGHGDDEVSLHSETPSPFARQDSWSGRDGLSALGADLSASEAETSPPEGKMKTMKRQASLRALDAVKEVRSGLKRQQSSYSRLGGGMAEPMVSADVQDGHISA